MALQDPDRAGTVQTGQALDMDARKLDIRSILGWRRGSLSLFWSYWSAGVDEMIPATYEKLGVHPGERKPVFAVLRRLA